jgi:hypothetical protein
MSIFGNERINSQDCRHVMILVDQELKSNQLGSKKVCPLLTYVYGSQLLFMKRGGQLIYAGPLGAKSRNLVEFFEVYVFSDFLTDASLHNASVLTSVFATRQFQECLKSGMAIILLHGCWKSQVLKWSRFLEWISLNTIENQNYSSKYIYPLKFSCF